MAQSGELLGSRLQLLPQSEKFSKGDSAAYWVVIDREKAIRII